MRKKSIIDYHKSPVISLRIKPYKLAKLIDGIRYHDKSFYPESSGKVVQLAVDIAINQTTYNLPLEPSLESQRLVAAWCKKTNKRKNENFIEKMQANQMAGPREQMTKEQLTYEQAMAEAKRIEQAQIAQANKGRAQATRNTGGNPLFTDIDLGSEKNSVTDFRPMSEEELDEKD